MQVTNSNSIRNPQVWLITPPMSQLSAPYPATAYLTGFLDTLGVTSHQDDLSLELALRVFSRDGISRIRAHLLEKQSDLKSAPPSVAFFLENFDRYFETLPLAIRFLQGRDPTAAIRIAPRNTLPEGPRFQAVRDFQVAEAQMQGLPVHEADSLDGMGWAFGSLGIQDRAKFLASLYLDDLVDVVSQGVDPSFSISRYAEKLAASQPRFDFLYERLVAPATSLIDQILEELVQEKGSRWGDEAPDLVVLTAPFPGNVYGAFRIAQQLRKRFSEKTRIALGGGYVNTELRQLKDSRVFDFFDYVTLDDGERPLSQILESLKRKESPEEARGLLRTFVRTRDPDGVRVVLRSSEGVHDLPQKDTGTPTYRGLPMERYLAIFEMLNPMHRIWSDGRWNKATLAHGCYWKKCNFCDVSLDYIARYDASPADRIVDRMIALREETGQSGFHFVDEAAPPAVLRQLSQRLIERKEAFTWWGNVRFDKVFDQKLVSLMADAGCVAVSGGLEVASDRLLKLMNKGVTVEQVARVTRTLSDHGILVHAYLMYGFPTQTVQETIDALERVRQLFAAGCIQSGFWHRFSTTIHSPIGKSPEEFGIRILSETDPEKISFAMNDLEFHDPLGVDHDYLGIGLKKALYNYMLGLGLEEDVRQWFPTTGKGGGERQFKVPKTQVPRNLIERALS